MQECGLCRRIGICADVVKYEEREFKKQQKSYTEKPFDRVVASQAVTVNLAGVIYDSRTYTRWEVTLMTDYETIMVFLGILALLVSFGTLLIALLAYIDRKNKRK